MEQVSCILIGYIWFVHKSRGWVGREDANVLHRNGVALAVSSDYCVNLA